MLIISPPQNLFFMGFQYNLTKGRYCVHFSPRGVQFFVRGCAFYPKRGMQFALYRVTNFTDSHFCPLTMVTFQCYAFRSNRVHITSHASPHSSAKPPKISFLQCMSVLKLSTDYFLLYHGTIKAAVYGLCGTAGLFNKNRLSPNIL